MANGPGGHLLTVLHAAEPTGPPLLALRFLQWLREHHPGWTTSTLLIDPGGGLEDEFAELGQVVLASPDFPYGHSGGRAHRALTARRYATVRRRIAALGPIDVAHVHCAGAMRTRPVLPDVPLLCHVHEMAVGLDLHLGPVARDHLCEADRYVVVSDAVRRELTDRYPIPEDRIVRCWEFGAAPPTPAAPDRGTIGVAAEAFLVVSSGVRHWRKAPELFVRTALAARELAPDVDWQFTWVGGADDGHLDALVRDAGLHRIVSFLPHEPTPQRWFAAADAFFLPAREDAFPLVCVEAALVGTPIVTFDSGGAAELVSRAGCGEVVPFPDVAAAASALVDLTHDRARCVGLGERARAFATAELTVDALGPTLLAAVQAARESRR